MLKIGRSQTVFTEKYLAHTLRMRRSCACQNEQFGIVLTRGMIIHAQSKGAHILALLTTENAHVQAALRGILRSLAARTKEYSDISKTMQKMVVGKGKHILSEIT